VKTPWKRSGLGLSSQTQDTLVYEDKANPLRFHGVFTSEDERFAFLNISDRGKGKKGNAVFYRDILKGQKTFTPIVAEIGDDTVSVIDNVGDNTPLTQRKLLIQGQNMAHGNFLCLGVHGHFLHQQADDLSSFSKIQIGQIRFHPLREFGELLDQL